jgi:hypothetical protein
MRIGLMMVVVVKLAVVGPTGKGQMLIRSALCDVFWNLPLKPDTLEQACRYAGQITVTQALFLEAKTWPLIFDRAALEDVRLIGTPLKAGVPVTERVGDCFAIAIVRCSGPAVLLTGGCQVCKMDGKGQRRGYNKGFGWQVSGTDGPILCRELLGTPALSFFDLSKHARCVSVLFPALMAAARHHEVYTKTFAFGHSLETKVVREELSRTSEVLKHLQRLANELQQSSFSILPVQLGITDLTEWTQGKDRCQSCNKGSLLEDILQQRCSCGLVSFKVYHRGQQRITPQIPAQYWGGMFVHMLKERCMQRFFTGAVLFEARGVTIGDPDGHCSYILLADNRLSRILASRSIRNHLCFVVNENVLSTVLTRHASEYNLEQTRTEMSETNFTELH